MKLQIMSFVKVGLYTFVQSVVQIVPVSTLYLFILITPDLVLGLSLNGPYIC